MDNSGVEKLANLIVALSQKTIPESSLQAARLCLLDTLGVGIYSSRQPEAKPLLTALSHLGYGSVAIWGRKETLDVENAALLCGTFCHLRELDDVHYAILHTGSVCVPSAMATAELEKATLGDVLRAVINGVEIMVRISLGMDYMDHRERGWHGTATCGAFGAAAAVGTILHLTEQEFADALGIAGSRTGGTWAFSVDGAMTKRLHPGLAARDGLVAAYLAKAGISGPHYVLEAEDGGFYRLFSKSWDLKKALAPSHKLEIENVEYKWFASCKSVHSPITAALQIHKEHPEKKPEDVQSVLVEVNFSALAMAGHPYRSDSVVSAQISIPYGIALGLQGRSGQADDYTLEALQDPVSKTLADCVTVVESEEFNALRLTKHLSGARVTVNWKDGTTSEAVVHYAKGTIADPLTEDDVIHKYYGLTTNILGEKQADDLCRFILHGNLKQPVSELVSRITPQS